MRTAAQMLIDHVKADFAWRPYLGTTLLICVALFINYSPLVNLWSLHKADGPGITSVYYFGLYGGMYVAAALLAQHGTTLRFLTNLRFWALAAVLITLVTLPKISIVQPINFREIEGLTRGELVFGSKCMFFLMQGVVAFSGLLMLCLVDGQFRLDRIGLTTKNWTPGPYLLMLCLVLPLVVAASFSLDFQRAYPQYRAWSHSEVFGLSLAARAAAFELCYSSAFVTVETLFRGALVIGMARLMGPRAILPAVAMYCVFHFGKPLGEAIGSVVGGYILSVFALHSRSVLGGIVIHLGVALSMELCAYAQYFWG